MTTPIERRTPFAVTHLPLLARLHLAAARPRRRSGRRFVGKPAGKLYRLLRAFGLGGRGIFQLDLGDRAHSFTFNVRNTQYSSLFIPPHDTGYEPEVCALVDLLLNDAGVFFDIGANWGYFSLYALSRRNYCGSVYAFEPFPSTYRDLEEIAQQSPFGAQLVVHSIALTDRDGDANMMVKDGLNSGLARLAEATHSGVLVRTARLDALGLPPPTLLKIDVEGAEVATLRGAHNTIVTARPYVIFESWREILDTGTTLMPFQELASAGYSFFAPCWMEGTPPVPVHNGSRRGPVPLSARFALVPFTPEQRFLLPDQINVLAVHASRVSELQRIMGCSAAS